jgi:hypothetical protein
MFFDVLRVFGDGRTKKKPRIFLPKLRFFRLLVAPRSRWRPLLAEEMREQSARAITLSCFARAPIEASYSQGGKDEASVRCGPPHVGKHRNPSRLVFGEQLGCRRPVILVHSGEPFSFSVFN